MKYIHEQPQIQNELLAWTMAETYHPYHGVKLVAEAQGLDKLAGIIADEGERASKAAGFSYVDSLSVEAPVDPELMAALEAGKEKYEPVLSAVRTLGNSSIINSTERALAGEQNAIVDEYQEKLVRTLKRNTSELVLANDEGNFIPEPETVTEDDLGQFADERGYSKSMAFKAWYALRQSSFIRKKLIKPNRPDDHPTYDANLVLVDSVLEAVTSDGTQSIGAARELLPMASPKSLQLLRDFAASVIARREGEQSSDSAAV